MNNQGPWYRRYAAIKLPDWLANPVVWFLAAVSALIWVEALFLLGRTGHWWLFAALGFLVVSVVGLMALAFSVNVPAWGGKAIRFVDVPKKRVMVLRWRLAGEKTPETDSERSLYIQLEPGLAVYSPWFYEVQKSGDRKADEEFVNLEPLLVPQVGTKSNAADGVLVEFDTLLVAKVTDVISFIMNVVTRQKMKEYAQQYLETGCQRITSVHKGDKITYADGKVAEFNGWDSSSVELSQSNQETQRQMGTVMTSWMNHWLSAGKKSGNEQDFGFEVKVKVNAINLPKEIRNAQERRVSAEVASKERQTEAEAARKAIKTLLEASEAAMPKEERELIMSMMRSNEISDELKKTLAEIWAKYAPNLSILHLLEVGIPGIENIVEQFLAGQRSTQPRKNKSKAKVGGGNEDDEEDDEEDTN